MSQQELQHLRQQLANMQAERDALARELGDLRAWLSQKLDLLHRSPGPGGLTILQVASDQEIVAEVERIKARLAEHEPTNLNPTGQSSPTPGSE